MLGGELSSWRREDRCRRKTNKSSSRQSNSGAWSCGALRKTRHFPKWAHRFPGAEPRVRPKLSSAFLVFPQFGRKHRLQQARNLTLSARFAVTKGEAVALSTLWTTSGPRTQRSRRRWCLGGEEKSSWTSLGSPRQQSIYCTSTCTIGSARAPLPCVAKLASKTNGGDRRLVYWGHRQARACRRSFGRQCSRADGQREGSRYRRLDSPLDLHVAAQPLHSLRVQPR